MAVVLQWPSSSRCSSLLTETCVCWTASISHLVACDSELVLSAEHFLKHYFKRFLTSSNNHSHVKKQTSLAEQWSDIKYLFWCESQSLQTKKFIPFLKYLKSCKPSKKLDCELKSKLVGRIRRHRKRTESWNMEYLEHK